MPACPIEQENNEVVPKLFGQVTQKQAHHLRVSPGKDQGGQLTKLGTHRRKHMDELTHTLPWHPGSSRLRRPTAPRAVNAPKAPFSFGHKDRWAVILRVTGGQNRRYLLGKVFLNASCFSTVPWGG